MYCATREDTFNQLGIIHQTETSWRLAFERTGVFTREKGSWQAIDDYPRKSDTVGTQLDENAVVELVATLDGLHCLRNRAYVLCLNKLKKKEKKRKKDKEKNVK